ncbi:FecR domain-containing protein [Chitinophaga pendula]|uniref:FecR family protein n=1 Tax=Chitinophaga TaxID=79328 RepID=UPI000BAF07DD|nr:MULTISPECIES: FecR family protein [Chitinophaga]ASZ11743.1 hypothetical protein CK934_12635 [Chitinophaga sp. MD30]UCJ05237.1 FecR domain-containing protein [Chitinophaga pendula]
MQQRTYTIDELADNSSFINFCLQRNAKDIAWWQHYIAQHPDQQSLITGAYQRVLAREHARTTLLAMKKRRQRQRFALIATIILIAGLGTWYFTANRPAPDSTIRQPGTHYTVYKGAVGTRTPIRLKDNTNVILNSSSILLVPDQFPTTSREVILNGEAWFDVTTDTIHPFSVRSDKLITSTIGTSFRMRSFEAQQGATVYLLRGKIRVAKSYHSQSDNQPEILEHGQMILANKEIDLMEKETFDPASQDQWLSGSVTFKENNFPSLIRKLEDWYATEITVKGTWPANTANLTLSVHNDTLQQLLDKMISQTGGTYKIKGNKVIISF